MGSRVALYSCEPPIRNALVSGFRDDKADSRDEWVEEEGAPFLFHQMCSLLKYLEIRRTKEGSMREEGGHTGQSHFS